MVTCFAGVAFGLTGHNVAILHNHAAKNITVYVDNVDMTSSLPLTVSGMTFQLLPGIFGIANSYRAVDGATGTLVTLLDNYGGWPGITICLPVSLFNSVVGLMGYFDGNFANDYVPQGVVPSNYVSPISNQSYVGAAFGDTWRVTSLETAFYYGPSESYTIMNDLTFRPFVFDAQPFSASLQATQVCAGLADTFYTGCLQDVTQTGDSSFAIQANNTGLLYNAQEAQYRGQGSSAWVYTVSTMTPFIIFVVLVML